MIREMINIRSVIGSQKQCITILIIQATLFVIF